MFMDFKFFDKLVQAAEDQRKLATQAWEQWVELGEEMGEAVLDKIKNVK